MTPSQLQKIETMREAGKSYGQIGFAIGMSAGAVSWYCLKHGIETPRPAKCGDKGPMLMERNGHDLRKFTPEEDAIIVEMDLAGAKVAHIAKRIGRRWNSTRGRMMTLARREERAMLLPAQSTYAIEARS